MDSVEKKPMNGSLASRIRKNLSFIEEDVDTNDLITSLIADGIIDFNDKELISKAGTKKERAIYLVSLLMSRGDRAYDCFLEALRKAKYTHIVDKVSDVSIRNRETSDLGAGASHENLVSVPLEKKVANLEGQMLIHKEKIKSLSERLDKVETKEELKIIQQEVNNLSQGPNNQSPQQPAPDACSPQVPKPAPAPVPSNEPSIKPTEPNILGPNSVRQQKPSAGPSKQPTEPNILGFLRLRELNGP
ncbi:unnamed protein product [Lymnaea stagnalis]|uniref:CARD domain-containing protein n=1 Tax=Lymnaea stagnalis TaxID=6523 RepID=A0AAV2HBA8_LYMST